MGSKVQVSLFGRLVWVDAAFQAAHEAGLAAWERAYAAQERHDDSSHGAAYRVADAAYRAAYEAAGGPEALVASFATA